MDSARTALALRTVWDSAGEADSSLASGATAAAAPSRAKPAIRRKAAT